MGLYCAFTPEDLGYPMFLEQDFLGETVVVEVDYGAALEAFCSTFLDIATTLVPVDTGFLQSTIESDNDGEEAWAEAWAEYAQYPEYGTWCQIAQPYFTPAVEAGLAAFVEIAGEAVDEAQRIMEDMLQSMLDAFTAQAEGALEFLGGLAMAIIAFVVMFPILVNVYGIMEALTGDKNSGYGAMIDMVDIIIT